MSNKIRLVCSNDNVLQIWPLLWMLQDYQMRSNLKGMQVCAYHSHK